MSRELALERELKHLNTLNSSVDMLLEATKKVGENVAQTKTATDNSSALLGDWVRILNQTKFTNTALQNPRWKGDLDLKNTGESSALERERAKLEEELFSVETENDQLTRSLHQSPKRAPKRVRR